MIATETEQKVVQNNSARTGIEYTAFGNSESGTWFISKDKMFKSHGFVPLLKLICIRSNKSIFHHNKDMPTERDILTDVNGVVLEVITVDWI